MSDKPRRLHVVTFFLFEEPDSAGSLYDAIEAGRKAMAAGRPGLAIFATERYLLHEGARRAVGKAFRAAARRITEGLFQLAAETQAMRFDESPDASDEPEGPS